MLLMVERLASEAAPMGLTGILRTVSPEVRVGFLSRFFSSAEAKIRSHEKDHPEVESVISGQHILEFPPRLAA